MQLAASADPFGTGWIDKVADFTRYGGVMKRILQR
jgi:hypothetical protein